MKAEVYIICDRNTKVEKRLVTLGDVAQLECVDLDQKETLKRLQLFEIHAERSKNYILNALFIIQKIHAFDSSIVVHMLGQTEFIVEFNSTPKKNLAWEYGKTLFVGAAIFFGSAFTIMAFNNDVAISDIFSQIYFQLTGQQSNGFTILELSYCIGLGVGILLFYNHFGSKKKERDPTPLQVEMRLYEEDVNTAMIENKNREGKYNDVS